jgi:ketosteroid isomerase-like protein
LCGGCKEEADPKDVARARRVIERYNEAWLSGDAEKMLELSTRDRVERLTDVDPTRSTGHREKAVERLGLIAEQTRVFMGYDRLVIDEVVSSEPSRVVFKIKAHHERDGEERTSVFVRRVVKEKGQWRLD